MLKNVEWKYICIFFQLKVCDEVEHPVWALLLAYTNIIYLNFSLKIDAGESSITSERQGKCEIFPFIIRILLNLVVISKALISEKTKYYAPQRWDKILPNFKKAKKLVLRLIFRQPILRC
jgi:hypothetical protein